MEEAVQEQSGETIVPPLLDKTWKRVLFGLFVIVAPIFNFSFVEALAPEWQSGKSIDYVFMFLLPEASFWFFPLLFYTITSYCLVLIDEHRFGKFFAVRLGIYMGVLLAFQYSLLTLFTWNTSIIPIVFLFIWMFPIFIFGMDGWIKFNWSISKFLLFLLISIVILFAIVSLFSGDSLFPVLFLLILPAYVAPIWSFLIALQASRWLWKYHETKPTLPRGLGIFAWLSAYAFALRFNILKMYELYNALPTAPPDCYIATAAAKGHPRFVGAQEVTLANGKSMRVNRQLQRLKAVEIAWMGVSATSHRWMRRVYDVIGKRLAAFIQNPILADVAFVLLIPVEWISFFVLKLVIPEIQSISDNLYHS